MWSGRMSTTLQVAPNATENLELQACFCKPGVYNLSNVQILAVPQIKGVAEDSVGPVRQKHTSPSLVVISTL